MTVKFIESFGNKRVYIKIDNLENITRRSIRNAFYLLGDDLKDTANKEILKKPKKGRIYIIRDRAGRRRRHRASAPGETHANLSGKLRRSLGYQIRGAKTLEFGYGVEQGKGAGKVPIYGKFLEFGTIKMEARPTLQNAISATNRNAEIYVGNQFKKLTR